MPTEVEQPTKTQPWPIRMLHGLVADAVPSRLGTDAMSLACILIERQDLLFGKPVGLFMSQLAQLCGDSVKNPRRTRAARQALIEDGWLKCDIPKNGERAEAIYQMVVKTTPTKTVVGEHVTPYQNGGGEVNNPNQNGGGDTSTPTKTVAAPQPKRYGHPNQNGSVTDPSITDPKYTDPTEELSVDQSGGKKVTGVFGWLPHDMRDIGKLIDWHKRVSKALRPVIGKTADDRQTVVAAAVHSWDKGDDAQRLFSWIIGKKRYDVISDEAMETANRLIGKFLNGDTTAGAGGRGVQSRREKAEDLLRDLGVAL